MMERTTYTQLFERLSHCVENVIYEKYALDLYINLLHNIQQLVCDRSNDVLTLKNIDSTLIDRLDNDLCECNLEYEIFLDEDDDTYTVLLYL